MRYRELPDEWLEIVRRWAANKGEIWEAHIFGSYAKGDAVDESDLDVAVVLFGEMGERLSYAMFEATHWQDELDALLPVQVQLEFADQDMDSIVWPAVQEHGLLVYRCPGFRPAS